MPQQALVYLNVAAGRKSGIRPEMISRRLEEAGLGVDLQLVGKGGEDLPPRIAGKDLVVVCGGDGTLHRILPFVVAPPLPVGLIPAGTANVLAYALGIPVAAEEALKIVLQGQPRSIALGSASGRYFHLAAGIGTDGYLLLKVPGYLKRFLGIAAFWITGAGRFWGYPLPVFAVETEGERITATMAVLANSPFYGKHLTMAPDADLFEAKLDLCVFKSRSHLRYLAYLWLTLLGRHTRLSDVAYLKVTEVVATSPGEVFVQLDGEPAGVLPRRFSVAEESLSLLL